MRDNAEQISRLYSQTVSAETTQNTINQSLDYIEMQQTELDNVLSRYEKECEDLFDNTDQQDRDSTISIGGLGLGPADSEREKSYKVAENVNDQLDDLSRNLSTMIDEVNLLSGGNNNSNSIENNADDNNAAQELQQQEDAVAQIAAILNAHLSSLQWIDATTVSLNDRVKEMENVVGNVQQRTSLNGAYLQSPTSTNNLNQSSSNLRQSSRGFGLSTLGGNRI